MNIFDLSTEDYVRFLLLFDSDREQAGEKYERLRRKLKLIFSQRRCNEKEIEDLVDKVFDQIFTMLIKRKTVENIDHLSKYIAKRHTLQRYWDEINKNQQNFISINDDFVIDSFINQNIQEERLKNEEDFIFNEIFPNLDEIAKRLFHLRFCIDKLTKTSDEKKMILGYYSSEDQKAYQIRKELADYLGITSGNLRIRVNRLQEKLFNCINNCLEKEVC